jgi:hypothetical protein
MDAAGILNNVGGATAVARLTSSYNKARPPCVVVAEFLAELKGMLEQCVTDSGVLTKELAASIRQSKEYRSFSYRISELQVLKVSDLTSAQRLSFFLNLYNLLVMQAAVVLGPPQGTMDQVQFFSCKYVVGELGPISTIDIEHMFLRAAMTKPSNFVGFLIPKLAKKDPRFSQACREREPRISFALCNGAYSSPPVVIYQPDTVDAQLEAGMRLYLESWVKLEPERQRVELPQVLDWYKADFCVSGSSMTETSQLIAYVGKRMSDQQTLSLFADTSTEVKVEYTPYSWSFYHFSEAGRYRIIDKRSTLSADELLKLKLNAHKPERKKPDPPDDEVCDPKTMRGGNAGTGAALIVD